MCLMQYIKCQQPRIFIYDNLLQFNNFQSWIHLEENIKDCGMTGSGNAVEVIRGNGKDEVDLGDAITIQQSISARCESWSTKKRGVRIGLRDVGSATRRWKWISRRRRHAIIKEVKREGMKNIILMYRIAASTRMLIRNVRIQIFILSSLGLDWVVKIIDYLL